MKKHGKPLGFIIESNLRNPVLGPNGAKWILCAVIPFSTRNFNAYFLKSEYPNTRAKEDRTHRRTRVTASGPKSRDNTSKRQRRRLDKGESDVMEI